MASFTVPSVTEDSDFGKDYYCTVCQKNTDADFYCKDCVKFFCGTCIHSHRHDGWRGLFKQAPYGKDKIMKWPLSKKMENFLMTCDLHKDEILTMYCPDHNQLCCSRCVERHDRQCFQVTAILHASKKKSTKFKSLSVRTQNTLLQIKQFKTYQEDKMKSLKVSYKEHEKDMVDGMRLDITSFLHQYENSTVYETHEHVQDKVSYMIEKITSLLVDFEKSSIKEKKEELKHKQTPLISVRNSCIRLHDELLQLHVVIQKYLGRQELSFIASKKCQNKIQQSVTYLRENFSNHVLTVNGKSDYYVKMQSDSKQCLITAICVLPNVQVLVADNLNKNVKLLNQQYQVVSHCDVTSYPQNMCLIAPSEVAVAVNKNASNTHEVQFITVTQSQLVPGRKFQLQHACYGIAHHQGDLFISSGTALYKYSLGGKLVCRLYENISDKYTVYKCAVSPTGKGSTLPATPSTSSSPLARDGTLLASLTDPELECPRGVCVTPAGQVLVCGHWSYTILQVDIEGRSKLATLATYKRDGVVCPVSVCYSSTTSSIIVGQKKVFGSDTILVFRVE